jgi:hypothetical protein
MVLITTVNSIMYFCFYLVCHTSLWYRAGLLIAHIVDCIVVYFVFHGTELVPDFVQDIFCLSWNGVALGWVYIAW